MRRRTIAVAALVASASTQQHTAESTTMANENTATSTPNAKASAAATKRYRVIHGQLGFDPETKLYRWKKGDTLEMAPDEAATHVENGLLALASSVLES